MGEPVSDAELGRLILYGVALVGVASAFLLVLSFAVGVFK
jgi:hypothetical protein